MVENIRYREMSEMKKKHRGQGYRDGRFHSEKVDFHIISEGWYRILVLFDGENT